LSKPSGGEEAKRHVTFCAANRHLFHAIVVIEVQIVVTLFCFFKDSVLVVP